MILFFALLFVAIAIAGACAFVIFWPLGLAMLAYILWGEMFGGSSDKAEAWVNKSKAWCNDNTYRHNGYNRWGQSSGNAAFDDYRAEQLKRLDEERKRLDEEIHAFHEYMRNLRMAKDREEFDRFMRDRNSNNGNSSNYGSGQSV